VLEFAAAALTLLTKLAVAAAFIEGALLCVGLCGALAALATPEMFLVPGMANSLMYGVTGGVTGARIASALETSAIRAEATNNLALTILRGPACFTRTVASCWRLILYRGQRLYQRDDLIRPDYISPADKYGRSNLKRMQQGLAPLGPDDKPI